MDNIEKIVSYTSCAVLVGAASYVMGCIIYSFFSKNDNKYKKEENKKINNYTLNKKND
ncbi:MAG: hypothetical protein QW041_01965 [Candidatus Pacearchaeota archaeon]